MGNGIILNGCILNDIDNDVGKNRFVNYMERLLDLWQISMEQDDKDLVNWNHMIVHNFLVNWSVS
jgi:hypothetical protein